MALFTPRDKAPRSGSPRRPTGPGSRLDALLADAPVGFALLDHRLRYLQVNEALAQVNGLSTDDHVGRTVREALPGLADSVEEMYASVLRTGEPVREFEVCGWVPGEPGAVRYWLESVYPTRAPDGRTDGIAVMVWEVTADRRAREELARLYDAEHEARATAEQTQTRLGLLADASARLAMATTESQLLGDLADLLAPRIADWCSVLLPDPDGRLRRVAGHTADPALDPITELLRNHPFVSADDFRSATWRTGRAARLTDLRWPSGLTADVPEPLRDVLDGLPRAAALAVPLRSRDQNLGILSLFRFSTGARFSREDELLATDLGWRAGAALDQLRTLAERTRIAALLQESLLPEQLPTVPGLEFASRYLAAEDAAEVGGDFYDAFPISDGGIAVVVGDVSGRGIDAAGLTGHARTTLLAVAADLPAPEALTRLNALLRIRTSAERFLTVAYLRLFPHPGTGTATLTVCLAGHPQPLLLGPDGTVTPLGRAGSLLGVLDTVELSEQTVELGPGSTVLLYTDGVTEAKGAAGEFGEERLVRALAGLAGRSAEEVVAEVERVVLDFRSGGADDLALLAVRLVPDHAVAPSAIPGAGTITLPRDVPGPRAVTRWDVVTR